jgi:hypothetical protein
MGIICRYLKATTYLADSGARNYLQPTDFSDIEVVWQNWREPTEEWSGIDSWRNLSSINYLCRTGPERFSYHLNSGEFSPEQSWRNAVSKPYINRR